MKPVISIANVTKLYGSSVGVKDVSLDVEPGKIFGFLGPNGAGKTTTISMIVDLIRPTSGTIKIFGLDAQKDGVAIRKRVGFLAGDFALDQDITGRQQLEYFGNLRGNFDRKRIQQLADRLSCNLDKRFKNLSRGNRQKVGLISALMHDPELLIFDEPTSGLDPLIQAEFNKIILEHKAKGKTAFISSHLLSEVQEICDHVAFIKEGNLFSVQDMKELSGGAAKQVKVTTRDKKLAANLKKLTGANHIKQTASSLSLAYSGDMKALIKTLAGHEVEDLSIQDIDLETIFMNYYEDDHVR